MRKLLAISLALLLPASAGAGPQAARDLQNTLQTRRVDAEFDKAGLDEFVRYVRVATGLNIVVRKDRIAKDVGDVEGIEITLRLHDVRVGDLLQLVLEPHGLGLKAVGNVLVITSMRDARGRPVLVVYDVADILVPIRDFPAPDINIYPTNYEPPEAPEPEIHRAAESADELAEMLRQFTGGDTWEDEGVGITTMRRHLFVRQYPAVHREIAHFLGVVRGLR